MMRRRGGKAMSDFAAEQYKKARKAGIKAFREAGGKGRYPYLTALDEILLHTKTAGKEELGVFEIPLAQDSFTLRELCLEFYAPPSGKDRIFGEMGETLRSSDGGRNQGAGEGLRVYAPLLRERGK